MLYYDLHIHSALSPCAEEDMTPCNICAMAALKGLDLIAVTDHNSGGNLRAVAQADGERELLFLPGIEVCTAEEVHILTYFPTVDAAEAMGAWCKAQLLGQRNKPQFFGAQRLMNSRDEVLGEEEALLIGALAADLGQVCSQARSLGGVPVPAHVFRSYGLMTVLGFFPRAYFLGWLIVALLSPIGGSIVWFARGEGLAGAVITAMPAGIIAAWSYPAFYTHSIVLILGIIEAAALCALLPRGRKMKLAAAGMTAVAAVLINALGLLRLLPF